MRFVLLTITLSGWSRISAEPRAVTPRVDQSLQRACAYLWSQQGEDGGWHSTQYGVLRSGQALTPFVLHALLQVPESAYQRPQDGVARALDFIRNHVDEHGALGHSDPDIIEYPVYSTSYALRCFLEAHGSFEFEGDAPLNGKTSHIVGWDQRDGILVNQMRSFLTEAQFCEDNGFTTASAAYGGWGLDAPQRPGEPGHMDLAHTRRALEALASVYTQWPTARLGADEVRHPVIARAQQFLLVVQKHPDAIAPQPGINPALCFQPSIPYDGGFYFSPIVPAANKGRTEESDSASFFRSYATATCDGILALLAAGVDRKDERMMHAIEWLTAHDDLDHPQGVPTDQSEPWAEAIRFYHYSVRAEAYAALDWPGNWREQLGRAVAAHQATDGSFQNTASPLMKEDDPIMCTTLAVTALSRCTNHFLSTDDADEHR